MYIICIIRHRYTGCALSNVFEKVSRVAYPAGRALFQWTSFIFYNTYNIGTAIYIILPNNNISV